MQLFWNITGLQILVMLRPLIITQWGSKLVSGYCH